MRHFILFLIIGLVAPIQAQIVIENDTLYGNEWIDYSQAYFKIPVAEEGIYRLDYQTLNDIGVFSSISIPNGNNFQLFLRGEQIPIATSTDGAFQNGDFIEFYGHKNKGEIDVHLYADPDHQLNPEYSNYNDTSYYFLTWSDTPVERYTTIGNDLSNPPPKEDFCFYTSKVVFSNFYLKKTFSGNQGLNQFEITDGYGSNSFAGTIIERSISTPHIYTDDNAPINLKIRIGSNNTLHNTSLTLNDNDIFTDTFAGWAVHTYNAAILHSQLNSENTVKYQEYAPQSSNTIAYLSITYPRTFHFDDVNYTTFSLAANNTQTYIELEEFDTSEGVPVLFDLTNGVRLETFLDNDILKAVLPPSGTTRNVSIGLPKLISSTDIKSVNFINYFEEEGEFILITHRHFLDDGAGNNYVQEYADYRASIPGGSLSPIVIDVQQLYDQFAFGINRHALSFRNFAHFIKKNWSSPQFVFLVGKGRIQGHVRAPGALAGSNFFIPTYGHLRASDNLLFSNNSTSVPFFPVGRLSAINPLDVQNYLNKVRTFEAAIQLPQTIENKAWMKRILHLAGGDPSNQAVVLGRMNSLKETIEASKFGADVITLSKTSTDVIQETPEQQLNEIIEEGVALISFFGHAASGSFDFDISSPEDYENVGKYPFIYSIACFAGNIFAQEPNSLSEQYILSNKGSIAFMSSQDVSDLNTLGEFAEEFYDQLGEGQYGKGLGEILQATIVENEITTPSLNMQKLNEGMIMHGDPSLKLYPHTSPDYLIDPASVKLSPRTPNTQTQTIDLDFDIANIGLAESDSISFNIMRTLPSGEVIDVTTQKVSTPSVQSSHSVILPNASFGDVEEGKHKLTIAIDPENNIEEGPSPEAENNNVHNSEFYVISNDILPAFPPNYGIISTEKITLKATTTDVFPGIQRYFMEIDTTKSFNSSIKKSTIFQQEGGVISWQPDIPSINNTVYYWRVSLDSAQTISGDLNWNHSSFILLDSSSSGWNQSHFDQFKEDKLNFITLKESDNHQFNFLEDSLNISIFNGNFYSFNGNVKRIASLFYNNLEVTAERGCGFGAGVRIYVIDPISLEPWTNNYGENLYESVICTNINATQSFNYFTFDLENRAKVIEFLDNDIPDGHIVLFETYQFYPNFSYLPEAWAADADSLGKSIFDVLEDQGAEFIRNTETIGAVPYVFFYRKGYPDFEYRLEELADTTTSVIEFHFAMPGSWSEGSIQPEKIGPAQSWGSFEWLIDEIDTETDEMSVDIYGIDHQNQDFLLIEDFIANDTSLAAIDATIYPYLRVELSASDSTNKTMAQLAYWRVYYTPIPEAALDPEAHFVFADTVQQGQAQNIEISINNLTSVDMDSLLVNFKVIDEQNNVSPYSKRIAPLLEEDTLIAHLNIDTKTLVGRQQVIMEINPNNDQPEQFHFNNIGIQDFFVELDNRNPLLDVTFDGVHILNKDIVSPVPLIHISLKDENKYLALEDTSLFRVSVLYPDRSTRRFYFQEDQLVFYPADPANLDDKNEALIEFHPRFEQDGIYQLIVRSKDETGNLSGTYDYSIQFEVITKQSISNLLNYPNPFTTSTQFVFTLTGELLPEDMQIQIMTVSGKIIREIDLIELGPIHIGRNLTEFRWNGTDEYGDQLANGVYIYRVVARKPDGSSYDHFNTGTDQYFKSGFGKMVLLR